MPSSREKWFRFLASCSAYPVGQERTSTANAEVFAVHFTSRSSTSNTSVAFPGITPPAPRAPYPMADGIVSTRVPPTFMPAKPLSQPGMTWPPPSGNSNGSLRSFELSNFVPRLSALVASYEPARVMHADDPAWPRLVAGPDVRVDHL